VATDILKIKYDKLLSELKFLEDDLRYHQTLLDEAKREFSRVFDETVRELGVLDSLFPSKQKPPKPTPAPRSPKPKKTPRKETRELFKKIATVTHPDKILELPPAEKEKKEEKFKEATIAAEEDKILSLHKIANEVGVEVPEMSETQLALFEEEIHTHKQKIENIQRTWMWAWLNSPDDDSKDVIMKNYINFLLTKTPA